MSRSDYERPSESQIRHHYKCRTCGHETDIESIYGVGNCHCGGTYDFAGESYPASADDWDECRDTEDGQWRRKGRWDR